MEALVGPASETMIQHLARHVGSIRKACPRCRWYRHGPAWTQHYGIDIDPASSHWAAPASISQALPASQADRAPSAGPASSMVPAGQLAQQVAMCGPAFPAGLARAAVWLAERPPRWGGAWGLGCSLCAAKMHRQAEAPGRRCRSEGSTWAKFEVRGVHNLQACDLLQHSRTASHLLAARMHWRPDLPLTIILKMPSGDDALLDGKVPQPPDWLRAWRAARTPASFSQLEAQAGTEHFIHSMRPRAVLRRAFQSLIGIMAEVTRAQKREWLRSAFSITIAVDDKGLRRLIRFKVDYAPLMRTDPANAAAPADLAAAPASSTDSAPASAPGMAGPAMRTDPDLSAVPAIGGSQKHYGARTGILGAFQCDQQREIEHFDDDYAKRMGDSIMEAVQAFCTPAGEVMDEALFRHICSHVRCFVADGAPSVQKCGLLLQGTHFPNLVLILRDPSHAIRIACKDPLVTEQRFSEQWTRLFGGKHGVIADIQHSEHLRAKLYACQKRVLGTEGQQGVCHAHKPPTQYWPIRYTQSGQFWNNDVSAGVGPT